ncbi:L-threonylcarbamoyladenylate synthase [Owenweeksia hongkongensis]|uniref:L-threonylcarbamoyladenylate synthase n=1 Tax=Owenweeksia hongkongensis TaxID=253245 RepID=UPI003A92A5BA
MAKISTNISEAQALLEKGELVAIPTETVYGLAANALNTEAVASIFEAKGRPHFDPLIVHLHDKSQLDVLCQKIPDVFYRLHETFSPGPITYILKKREIIPDLVTSGNDTVGIRFPNHPLTRELLFESGLPLAAPSANPFGYVSPTTAQHVENQLGKRIPYILDGGPCSVGIESTIIDLSSDKLKILRLGGLALEEIEEITGKIEVTTHSSSNPQAPGMLSSHYSPGKKLMIGNIDELLKTHSGKSTAIISLSKTFEGIPIENQKVLSPSGDLKLAAANLFKVLRELDRENIDVILAELMPNIGLGPAINDRLKRAAH